MPSNPANWYYQDLKRAWFSFACSLSREDGARCGASVLPAEFERHCRVSHGLDSRACCVWCFACGLPEKRSWPKKSKRLHVDHLRACFERFRIKVTVLGRAGPSEEPVADVSASEEPSEEPVAGPSARPAPRLLSLTHACEARHLYGREPFDGLALDADSILLDTVLPELTFRDANLNLAASCVRAYLGTRDTHDWLHVVVRGVALASFVEALLEDGPSTRVLPFSCWCDGGTQPEYAVRRHRHFVVASRPKDHFRRDVWKRVRSATRLPLAVKRSAEIRSPLHLVNTLGYVSHRRSSCNFYIRSENELARSDSRGTHHFYVDATLPESYRLPLVLQWDGGVRQLLKQETLQNVSVPRIASSVQRVSGRWVMPLREMYKVERGLVLPVDRCFVPTDRETRYFLHLASGRKLHFEKTAEELSESEWFRKQVEGGNCFYEAVGEEMWHPRQRDQKVLNQTMPLRHALQDAKRANDSLKRELEGARGRIASLERELGEVKRENASLKRENGSLKRKLEGGASQPATRKHGPA